MDYFPLLLLVASGVGWWRVAEQEEASRVTWLALSVGLNLAALVLIGTLTAMLLSQALLFIGIAVWRVWREDREMR